MFICQNQTPPSQNRNNQSVNSGLFVFKPSTLMTLDYRLTTVKAIHRTKRHKPTIPEVKPVSLNCGVVTSLWAQITVNTVFNK